MKKKIFMIYSIFLILFLILGFISAQDFSYLISNSENWKDVYSTVLYANLNGVGSDFLVSTPHGPILLAGINKNNDIRIISSKKNPYVFNYESMVRNTGFRNAEEIIMEEANLEIPGLIDVENFIIVGETYGYNAIAVAPYAIQTNSWVFLADRANIIEIDNI